MNSKTASMLGKVASTPGVFHLDGSPVVGSVKKRNAFACWNATPRPQRGRLRARLKHQLKSEGRLPGRKPPRSTKKRKRR
jgi:hypothetical protein